MMSSFETSRVAAGSAVVVAILLPWSVYAQADLERGGDCERRCHQLAEDALHDCRREGDDAQRCRHRAKTMSDRCFGEQCESRGDCEAGCQVMSADSLDACLSAGGTPEDCEEQANEALIDCVLHDCGHLRVCRKRCRIHAARFRRRCVADGGDPRICSDQAREMGRDCADRCSRICGGPVGLECEEGEFCKMPPGACDGSDNFGICFGIPDGCPDVWEPVCGCDHLTYGNRCEADAAAVSVVRRGECPIACDSTAADDCPGGTFCRSPIGQCEGAGVDGELVEPAGWCAPIPETCPEEFRPVCGCDGVTYDNRCEADSAGVSVASRGECRVPCTAGGGECTDQEAGSASTHFCRIPDGECADAAAGFCAPLPSACRDVSDPVCGCDGVTYANRCNAHQAGVTVDHAGECE